MNVRTIDLDSKGLPEAITVQMTRAEAALIATAVGRLSPKTADEQFGAFGPAFRGIYDALVGDVFNRFWEDGVDGVIE